MDWQHGRDSPPDYDAPLNASCAGYAQLVGVDSADVAVGSQVSVFAGLVAASLPDRSGVLTVQREFTSIVLSFLAQAGHGDRDPGTAGHQPSRPPKLVASLCRRPGTPGSVRRLRWCRTPPVGTRLHKDALGLANRFRSGVELPPGDSAILSLDVEPQAVERLRKVRIAADPAFSARDPAYGQCHVVLAGGRRGDRFGAHHLVVLRPPITPYGTRTQAGVRHLPFAPGAPPRHPRFRRREWLAQRHPAAWLDCLAPAQHGLGTREATR